MEKKPSLIYVLQNSCCPQCGRQSIFQNFLKKLKFIYISETDRKCVSDCKETLKQLNHKNECVKECPKSFLNNKKEG